MVRGAGRRAAARAAAAALAAYREALELRRALGDAAALGESLLNVGFAYHQSGGFDSAATYFREADATFAAADDAPGRVRAGQNLGLLELARGDWAAARERLGATLVAAEAAQMVEELAVSALYLAELDHLEGRLRDALAGAERAERAFAEREDRRGQVESALRRATIWLDAGRLESSAAILAPLLAVDNVEQRGAARVLEAELALARGARLKETAMSTLKPIRVLVADDHNLLREGLVALLAKSGDCQVVGEAADGVAAIEEAQRTRPDVAVIDLSMPRVNGIEVVRRLAQNLPATRILVVTMHAEEEYVLHVVRAGASGFLLKDSAAQELLAAVRALAAGRGYFGPHASRVLAQQVQQPSTPLEDPYRGLTPREREVFHLVVEGLTTKEIARRLEISTKTAENHRTRVLDKLGVRNTAELIRYAVRHGLID